MNNKLEVEKYLKQALVNEELVLLLGKICSKKKPLSPYKWMFVVIFYSALHYFNAFLSGRGEPIPKKHDGKDGRIEKAKSMFFTDKDGIKDYAGGDFANLFQWGRDVRYNPEKAAIIKEADLVIAQSCLDGVRLVTFNDLDVSARISKSGKSLIIKEKDIDYLFDLHKKRK